MNIKRFFQIMLVATISMWTVSATAQDDAYFDPSTDEAVEVETKQYKKAQSQEDEALNRPSKNNTSISADDFYFTRRIRRFNRTSRNRFGFFNNWYTNDVFYNNSFGTGWGISTRPQISVVGGNVYNAGYNPYTSTSYYSGYSTSNTVGLGVNNSYDPCAQYGGYGYSQNGGYLPTSNRPTGTTSRPNYNYGPRKGGKVRSVGVVKPSRTQNTAASRPSGSSNTNATRSSSRKVRSSSRSRSSYSTPRSTRSSSTRSSSTIPTRSNSVRSSSSSNRSSSTRSSSSRSPRRR